MIPGVAGVRPLVVLRRQEDGFGIFVPQQCHTLFAVGIRPTERIPFHRVILGSCFILAHGDCGAIEAHFISPGSLDSLLLTAHILPLLDADVKRRIQLNRFFFSSPGPARCTRYYRLAAHTSIYVRHSIVSNIISNFVPQTPFPPQSHVGLLGG